MIIGWFSDFILGFCIGSVISSLWLIYFQLKRIADKYIKESE